jgi:hypothetical protein
MKTFSCRCNNRIFFDSTDCRQCGSVLGFDPVSLNLLAVEGTPEGILLDSGGNGWQLCRNRIEHGNCNWLVPADSAEKFCLSCRLDEIIPNLDTNQNFRLWSRLEAAKRRMLYSLLMVRLPVHPDNDQPGLRFRFLEDQSRNPNVLEPFVMTGHVRGTITINVSEADDAARHIIREYMCERYRTLLGHFRHEVGHYYFDLLVPEGTAREEFRSLFGDERKPYADALQNYYRDGASPDWAENYVSAYASAHPHEDWAETFAHYLHIQDALETADQSEFASPRGERDWLVRWLYLSIAINELNRSLGAEDPYPFVLTDSVAARLRFIDRRIGQMP